MESRLFDQKIKKLMVLTQELVAGGYLGSPFGWRIDPLNGLSTGPHLHFGVLVQGVYLDTQKFLTAGQKLPGLVIAAATLRAH